MAQTEKATSPSAASWRHAAQTPEEQQALQFLVAANDIATEIEHYRRWLRRARSDAEKRRIESKISEASERLCNIFALVELQVTKNVRQVFRDQLTEGMAMIRAKLAEMGTKVMLRKIKAIHGRAEKARSGRAYPIGLAAKLERNYDDVMDNLRLFGGEDILTEPQQELIDATRDVIANLNEFEESLGMTRNFDDLDDDDFDDEDEER